MHDRSSDRIDTKIEVDIAVDGAHYSGHIVNVSEEGVGTQIVAVPISEVLDFHIIERTILELKIKAAGVEAFTLNCEVKWTRVTDDDESDQMLYMFGAELIKPSERFRHIINNLS